MKEWIEDKMFLGILMVAMLIFLLFANAKSGFFIDELYSYGLANASHQTDIAESPIYDRWIQNAVENPFSDYLTVGEKEGIDFVSAYQNQIRDVHPPFYYMLLHGVSGFFRGSYSKWIGLSLNLVFLILTLCIVYKLSKMLFREKNLAFYASVFFYAICCMSVSNAVYIRMYMLLALLQTAYLYLHLRLLHGRHEDAGKMMIGSMVLLYFGVLTQYYFVIPAFFTSLLYLFALIRRRKMAVALRYCLFMLLSLVLAILSFPFVFEQIGGKNNAYVETVLAGSLVSRMIQNGISFVSIMNYGFLGTKIVLFLFVAVLLFGIMLAGNVYSKTGIWKNSSKKKFFQRKWFARSAFGESVFGKKAFSQKQISRDFWRISFMYAASVLVLTGIVWVPASRYYYALTPMFAVIFVYALHIVFEETYFYVMMGLLVLLQIYGYGISLRNSDFKTMTPVEYMYLGERKVKDWWKKEGVDVLLITDYKNATVTQELDLLANAKNVYITDMEHLGEVYAQYHSMQDRAEKAFLVLDTGTGLWGSGYTEEMFLDVLREFNEPVDSAKDFVYEKELTRTFRLH